MLNTNLSFLQETTKQQNQPVFLYTIFDYDGAGNNLYFTNSDENVTFDSIEYLRFPIAHAQTGENTKGQIDEVSITVSNVSREIEYYLYQYDAFRTKKISIKTVFANQLDDPLTFIEEIFYINDVTADATDVSFNASSKLDVLDINLPRRIYTRQEFPGIPTKGKIYVG